MSFLPEIAVPFDAMSVKGQGCLSPKYSRELAECKSCPGTGVCPGSTCVAPCSALRCRS